ncbi:Peripherin-2 [Bagarius yarrelli]|uniref:Peripherin-2 n=1 Tax=Bagarius yarrelli TaxID=175774 RepID=A0A556TNJ9_BAGYA|nr:Peripherin-2 [Bagarius yarrelli]
MKKHLENNFIPIQKTSKDECKLQKNDILSHQDVPDHHINQHNFRVSSGNNYDSEIRTDFHQNFKDTDHNTLSRASVYIHSSTSSSSSASCFSESSLDSEWHLLLNKPQHSVSCSNLPEARIFQDEASMNADFKLSNSECYIHHHQQKQQHFGYFGSQQQVSELGLKKSPLYSCQSKSEEGLLQSITQGCSTRGHGRPHSFERNQLYKTTSLIQTDTVRDKAAATINMAKPQRAVSSIQLPSKGILKNKDKRQKHRIFQKVKSMEALSTREQTTSPHKQSSKEALRKNFVKEKIEFSAFLDEITRQVISPSKLSSFRINPSIAMTSHKLANENRKQSAKAFNQRPVDFQKLPKQQNVQPVKSKNVKERTDSSKQKCKSASSSGVPHQHQHRCRQEKQHFTSQNSKTTLHKNHQEKYMQFPNKCNSTSPESILQEKHFHTKGKQDYKDGYDISRGLKTKHKVASLPAGLDMGMEFPKKTFRVTDPNLENINKDGDPSYRRQSKQSHRDSVSSLDRAEYLEQDNKDLHQNLLQIMLCIANVKAELQCIRTELSSITEKCKNMALLKMKFPFQKRVRLAQGLWLLSWVAMVSGAITFAMGVFLKTELFRRAEVMHNNDIHIVPNLLIMVGLTSVGINICAGKVCQDSLDASRFPRWKNILTPFFCLSLFFTSLLLVAMILSYALQPSLEESLKVGLKNGIRFYKDTDTPGRCFQKETIDHLQIEFQCCGNTNYRDWFEVQWVNNRYLDFTSKEVKDRIKSNVDGRYLMDGVPFSCCNPASPRPCIQYHLLDNLAHYNYEYQSEELNLYNRGCRQALVNYYMGLMNSIGPGVLAVFLIQMTVLTGLRYLQTSMEAVEGQENVEIETEGYILEKGVMETVKEFKEKVMKLFQQGQVEVAPPEAEPAAASAEKADTASS